MSEFVYSTPRDVSYALRKDPEIIRLKNQHAQEVRQAGVVEVYDYSIDIVLGELMLQIASQEESIHNGLSSEEIDLRMVFLGRLYPNESSDFLKQRMYTGLKMGLETNMSLHDDIISNRKDDRGLLVPAYDTEYYDEDETEIIPRSFIFGKIDPTTGIEIYGTSIDVIQLVDSDKEEQWMTKTFSVDQANLLIDQYNQQLMAGLFTDEAFEDATPFGDVDGLTSKNIPNADLRPTLFR